MHQDQASCKTWRFASIVSSKVFCQPFASSQPCSHHPSSFILEANPQSYIRAPLSPFGRHTNHDASLSQSLGIQARSSGLAVKEPANYRPQRPPSTRTSDNQLGSCSGRGVVGHMFSWSASMLARFTSLTPLQSRLTQNSTTFSARQGTTLRPWRTFDFPDTPPPGDQTFGWQFSMKQERAFAEICIPPQDLRLLDPRHPRTMLLVSTFSCGLDSRQP